MKATASNLNNKKLNIKRMSPSDVLEKVPRELFRHILAYMKDAQILLVASSLAYTTILSIVPLLAVSFAIFQAFGGLETLYATVEPLIMNTLAPGTGRETMTKIRGFVGNIHAGAVGAGGLVALLFTSMSMLNSAEKSINRIWKTTVHRNLFHRIATYWLFISLGPLAFAFILGLTSSDDLQISAFLPRGLGGFLIKVAIFMMIYKFVPNRKVNWLPALVAGAFSTALWNTATWGYGLYTSTVLTYNKIYGSLGAIPIILLWIYIVWIIILTGAALAAAIQNRIDLK